MRRKCINDNLPRSKFRMICKRFIHQNSDTFSSSCKSNHKNSNTSRNEARSESRKKQHIIKRQKYTSLLGTKFCHHVELRNLVLLDTQGHYNPVFLDNHGEKNVMEVWGDRVIFGPR